MKIAFINKYQDKVNRGAETFISEISKRLSKNHEVDVLTKINFSKKYDVVIPTNGRLQVFIVRLWTWMTGAKMIVSGQSGVGLDDRLNLYALPDYFVALTDFALQENKKRNPFIKMAKIPNGVDLEKFTPKKTISTSKEKVVLAVGAFTNEKRHELTIKALANLKNVKLLIAGGGGDKKGEIDSLGKEVLGSDRFETIQTTNDKMPDIYKKADLFVFPTVSWESFGIVLLEAMSCNLPVVCTDDPIRREIVGNAGIFVDPNNTEEFANAINKALNTKWGDLPRKQAEKFSWDKIAREYEELFQSLV